MTRVFPNRLYASGVGTRWALWRWSDAQSPYLDRLFLIKTPWFSVCLNWINEADVGDPHDHTSAFLSLLLKGWYVEHRLTYWSGVLIDRVRRVQFFNYMRGSHLDAHQILSVSPRGCLTLCLMGPKVREWGYHVRITGDGPEGGDGWIHWSEYNAPR